MPWEDQAVGSREGLEGCFTWRCVWREEEGRPERLGSLARCQDVKSVCL